jgi:hypothetical protein
VAKDDSKKAHELPVEIWQQIFFSLTSLRDAFRIFPLINTASHQVVRGITPPILKNWLEASYRNQLRANTVAEIRLKLQALHSGPAYERWYDHQHGAGSYKAERKEIHRKLQSKFDDVTQNPSNHLLDLPYEHWNSLGQKYIQFAYDPTKTFISTYSNFNHQSFSHTYRPIPHDFSPPPKEWVTAFSEWALPLYQDFFGRFLVDQSPTASRGQVSRNEQVVYTFRPDIPRIILEAFFRNVTPEKIPDVDFRYFIIDHLVDIHRKGYLIDTEFFKNRMPKNSIVDDSLYLLQKITQSLVSRYPLNNQNVDPKLGKNSKIDNDGMGYVEDFQLCVTLFTDYINPQRIPDPATRHDLIQKCIKPFVELSQTYPRSNANVTQEWKKTLDQLIEEQWIKVLKQLIKEKDAVNAHCDALINQQPHIHRQFDPIQTTFDQWISKMTTFGIEPLQQITLNALNPARFRIQKNRSNILESLVTFGSPGLLELMDKQNKSNRYALNLLDRLRFGAQIKKAKTKLKTSSAETISGRKLAGYLRSSNATSSNRLTPSTSRGRG